MEFPHEFEAHGVRLRQYRDQDAAGMAAGLNDPETRRFQQGSPQEITVEQCRAWIEAVPTRFGPESDRVVHAVGDPTTGELVAGTIMIVNASRLSAELGFWVCPAFRGRGTATATARALTELCFAQGLRRIEMVIQWENLASQRVALAAGFHAEGDLRQVVPGAGAERHDALLWSRLPDDADLPFSRPLPALPDGTLTDGVVRVRPVGPGDRALLPEHHCSRAPVWWLLGEQACVLVLDATTGAPLGEVRLRLGAPGAVLSCTPLSAETPAHLLQRAVLLVKTWARGIDVGPVATIGQAEAPSAGVVR
ncbi:GNAT family N-acetyltransferase (plasmid) [Streptomyces sp. HUAS TT11]|uniref:GNAT family N-acetyltransferase n=1 Tax=Streptomyces sp. HUAS TT11 TaxID=3447508 RepID=UPI003F65A3E5